MNTWNDENIDLALLPLFEYRKEQYVHNKFTCKDRFQYGFIQIGFISSFYSEDFKLKWETCT